MIQAAVRQAELQAELQAYPSELVGEQLVAPIRAKYEVPLHDLHAIPAKRPHQHRSTRQRRRSSDACFLISRTWQRPHTPNAASWFPHRVL